MCYNESDFPDPEEFRPERFLTPDGKLKQDSKCPDPVDISFGFGRRFASLSHRSENPDDTFHVATLI